MRASGSLMPPQNGNAPLDIVIAVMAFLAALALGASLIAGRTADSWQAGLSGKLTVQILPTDGQLADSHSARDRLTRETGAALQLLQSTDGIAYAAALSEADELKLVAPWIGEEAPLEDLPLPQLIDVGVVPGADLDVSRLRARLKSAAPHAVLDDHGYWLQRLRDFAGTVRGTAFGILFLIAVATAAVVSFATRARLDMHREMVALLHQMGARSGFIARTFEGWYFRAALMAGTIGTAVAAALFLLAGGLETTGVAVPFLPPLALKPEEFLWLIAVPAGSGLIGLLSARVSVFRVLAKTY